MELLSELVGITTSDFMIDVSILILMELLSELSFIAFRKGYSFSFNPYFNGIII